MRCVSFGAEPFGTMAVCWHVIALGLPSYWTTSNVVSIVMQPLCFCRYIEDARERKDSKEPILLRAALSCFPHVRHPANEVSATRIGGIRCVLMLCWCCCVQRVQITAGS